MFRLLTVITLVLVLLLGTVGVANAGKPHVTVDIIATPENDGVRLTGSYSWSSGMKAYAIEYVYSGIDAFGEYHQIWGVTVYWAQPEREGGGQVNTWFSSASAPYDGFQMCIYLIKRNGSYSKILTGCDTAWVD